eukprot:13324019-Ditylum_brightwellii.AAC.1
MFTSAIPVVGCEGFYSGGDKDTIVVFILHSLHHKWGFSSPNLCKWINLQFLGVVLSNREKLHERRLVHFISQHRDEDK